MKSDSAFLDQVVQVQKLDLVIDAALMVEPESLPADTRLAAFEFVEFSFGGVAPVWLEA